MRVYFANVRININIRAHNDPGRFMQSTALILEDSQTQAQIICKMVSKAGWSAVHCETVREALDTLKLVSVQALFMDVFVGQHNALLHLPQVRKLAPHVPLIVMTAGSGQAAIGDTLTAARQAGADFVLRKPFTENVVAGILETIGGPGAGPKRTHLLVIDDSRTIRSFCRQALEAMDFRVSEAGSMEEAFGNVDIAHVDLVLCDVFMPGMGGLKGMKSIKATWPRVKILAMSAGIEDRVSDTDALNATRRLGVDAQISKPFSADDLCHLVGMLTDAEAA